MYPKWEAILALREKLPARMIPGAALCHTENEVVQAWAHIADQRNYATLRTDRPQGGLNLPFMYNNSLEEGLRFVRSLRGRDLAFIVNEAIVGRINGKAVRVDATSVVVEYAECQSAREVDAGRVNVLQVAISDGPTGVWGETVLKAQRPAWRQGLQLDVLYREMLRSGLAESAWSITDAEHRLVLWG